MNTVAVAAAGICTMITMAILWLVVIMVVSAVRRLLHIPGWLLVLVVCVLTVMVSTLVAGMSGAPTS
jgi:hypothetical protein